MKSKPILEAIQRTLATAMLLGYCVIMVFGLGSTESEYWRFCHRWGTHLLVIFAWIAVPTAIAVRFGEKRGSVGFVLLLLFVLSIALFIPFTGYLSPDFAIRNGYVAPSEEASLATEETRNRFIMLHQIVLPTIGFIAIGTWTALAWRSTTRAISEKQNS